MIGIEAISAHNGWAMSLIGITIVYIGLVFLSLVVSQIKKILPVWEKFVTSGKQKKELAQQEDTRANPSGAVHTREMTGQARQYRLLAKQIGGPFSLSQLANMARAAGLRKPEDIIEGLVASKQLLPDEGDAFVWNSAPSDSE